MDIIALESGAIALHFLCTEFLAARLGWEIDGKMVILRAARTNGMRQVDRQNADHDVTGLYGCDLQMREGDIETDSATLCPSHRA